MKLIGIALAIITSSSNCNAFAPHQFSGINTSSSNNRRSQPLHAEELDGWKIDGLVKPVNNFILIEKEVDATESEGGILLSQSVSS